MLWNITQYEVSTLASQRESRLLIIEVCWNCLNLGSMCTLDKHVHMHILVLAPQTLPIFILFVPSFFVFFL
jgi:hypothetical protein